MIRTESSGGWQNRDCSIALPYVCKKKLNAPAEPELPSEPPSRPSWGGAGGVGHPMVQPQPCGTGDAGPPCSCLTVRLKSELTGKCH